MNPLLRLAGLYVDTVLKTWFPLEKEPSLEDLERSDALGRLVFLVEDIRNTVSSVVSETAESPEMAPSARQSDLGSLLWKAAYGNDMWSAHPDCEAPHYYQETAAECRTASRELRK